MKTVTNKLDVHFSSKTDIWATPQPLFDELNDEFGFTIDVCALPENAKCKRYYTPEDDGLKQDWRGETVYLNPPYGRAISKWMQKAWLSSKQGATVVCLLPARTDTKWWHSYCADAEIRFLKGRLKFGDAKSGAPFPSAIVILGKDYPPAIVHWDYSARLLKAA
jgi:phage N-6-adenine-methyltransferase